MTNAKRSSKAARGVERGSRVKLGKWIGDPSFAKEASQNIYVFPLPPGEKRATKEAFGMETRLYFQIAKGGGKKKYGKMRPKN